MRKKKEFRRIVIDKSKRTPDAEHEAAQPSRQNRVGSERGLPLKNCVEPIQEEETIAAEPSEQTDGGRQRGRRGRDAPVGKSLKTAFPHRRHLNHLKFPTLRLFQGDPSIERIVDEEETAANGEMFKDARLRNASSIKSRYRIQHGRRYSLAEIGSLLSGGFGDGSFQRVDDGEDATEVEARTGHQLLEAHVQGFVDEMELETFNAGSFERISDEEEAEALIESKAPAGRRSKKATGETDKKKKPSVKSAAASKAAQRRKLRRSLRARSALVPEMLKSDVTENAESYPDTEARLVESQTRSEFATRRGGRRRRRSGKPKPGQPAGEAESPGSAESRYG
jgi:hypothetical protein